MTTFHAAFIILAACYEVDISLVLSTDETTPSSRSNINKPKNISHSAI